MRRSKSGDLDLGIAYRPNDPGDLWFEPLYNEEMVLVVAQTHPLAQRKRIRMVELHRQELVLLSPNFSTRTMLDECFRACGAEPAVVAEMSTVAPMLGLVARTQIGAIVAINAVTESMAGLAVIPLESPDTHPHAGHPVAPGRGATGAHPVVCGDTSKDRVGQKPAARRTGKGSNRRRSQLIVTPTLAPAATTSRHVASSSQMPSCSRAERALRSGSPAICTASKPAPVGL